MTTLQLNNQSVKIDAGELISYKVGGHEFIHQKGSPGWRNADTEMFPIIGPTNIANFRVKTPKGDAIQDQHGLLREMEYKASDQNDTSVIFVKKYLANTKVPNSKFPNKSTEKELSWPYDFQFKKAFELKEETLEISFEISGEQGMPFMLGYHPAFKLTGIDTIVDTGKKTITIDEVLAVGSNALLVREVSSIVLKDKKSLKIETSGFGNFMLWTEVPNMVCIEPITFYPYAVEQKNLNTGFEELGKKAKVFKVTLTPQI
ncbi:aldose 1-epimerase [Maribacter sp. CXY002]|uniref:aldose epimerase family protein n=1 Tax=Maribacter luteocoastalis TaxID=3407671 RepID=UPI003B673A29